MLFVVISSGYLSLRHPGHRFFHKPHSSSHRNETKQNKDIQISKQAGPTQTNKHQQGHKTFCACKLPTGTSACEQGQTHSQWGGATMARLMLAAAQGTLGQLYKHPPVGPKAKVPTAFGMGRPPRSSLFPRLNIGCVHRGISLLTHSHLIFYLAPDHLLRLAVFVYGIAYVLAILRVPKAKKNIEKLNSAEIQ